MKNSVLFMAFPAFLVAAFFIINKPAGKSCPMEKDKAACMRMCMSQCSNQCGDMGLTEAAPDTLRPDPICDMKVDDKKGDTIHYKGHIFGFCSKYCRTEFLKNPDKYLPKK